MERPSVVFNLLVIILFFAKVSSSMTVNYVKPFTSERASPCSNMQRPCLTLNEYASNADEYFVNNSRFYFHPGIHRLKYTLNLVNLYNFSFLGLPNGDQVVTIAVDSSASITWNESWNIEISSIMFTLHGNFTFIMRFEHSQLVQLTNVSIYGNGYSGCSSIIGQQGTFIIKNSVFNKLNGFFGAAIMMVASNLTFGESNLFTNNTALSGGSIHLSDSRLILNGTKSVFWNNKCTAVYYDELIARIVSICNYPNRTNVINGEQAGGAIFMDNSNFTIQGNVSFELNTAGGAGGAMQLNYTSSYINGSLSLKRNKAVVGGAVSVTKGDFIIQGRTSFIENSAGYYGSALYILFTNFKYKNMNNTAIFSGNDYTAIKSIYSNITFIGTVSFHKNVGFEGGAIRSYASNVIFSGTIYFDKNMAVLGGAIFLNRASKLIFKPKLSISFILNHANDSGGALYVTDSRCSLRSKEECFIAIESDVESKNNVSLHFENNSAGNTGSILYGGQLDHCKLLFSSEIHQCDCKNKNMHADESNALEILISMSTINQPHNEGAAWNISSPATIIHFCKDDNEITYNNNKIQKIYPGQHFNVPLIAFGQGGYPVPAKIFWETKKLNDYYRNAAHQYRLSPISQPINTSNCTNITFQLYSTESTTVTADPFEFNLRPENPVCQNLVEGLTLSIHVQPCPIGFNLSLADSRCDCAKKLKELANKCYIDSNSESSVERMKNNFWISQPNNKTLILYEFRCPLDYCINNFVKVSLCDPSVQCDFNRTGMLCGQCQKNFSLALGSLHCIQCNNNHIALIAVFVLAGVLLITVLFILRLTVSVGTLNGLLFYANIIQANHQAYFPRITMKFNIFNTFISWLNLDLGVESCFYDGMDIYTYSWLQFLFPFYVWLLVGCIILACRYSQSVAKRLGKNPVAVLATLLLMSYSKILGAVIVPLTWTYLTYYTKSNETRSVVWMYDASIPYFGQSKHIALGLFAILCVAVFILPYISLLFFGHWLQGCSNWWILSWLNKIKPFMDAYHAPYRKHTRYWTGLLLITRLGLFLSFANDSESVNTAAVISVTVALLAIRFRVYEHLYNDVLESFFILNLGIFSVATFYLNEKSEDVTENQLTLSKISIGIAFITFLGILLFHISLVLKSSNIWKIHMLPFIQKSLLLSKIVRITPVKDQTRAGDKDAAELQALPTSTEINVDLREPLLDITESQAAP